ncbi:MAG: AsmA family protein [Desulfobacterales bacterium]|nr:AsmA family protein [Desulfobacterales bacterium]
MGKVMKWGGIALGVVVVLIVGAVVLVPMFVDVQKYKPEIEALVTKQTGRTFSMGDEIKLSVFPWVGVQLSDLALGNADGFDGDQMISVKRFEVRLKVMPLLSRQIQVDTFLMDSPQIRLVKNKAGRGNWEGIGPTGTATAPAPEKGTQTTPSEGGMPISSLMVGTFSITGGQLSFNDMTAGSVTEIADLNLNLKDISLDKPVTVDFSATLNGKPLSLSGTAGPIGTEPGKSDIKLDLMVKALDALELSLKGKLIQPATAQKFDLAVDLAPFSPRKLFEALGQPFPVETTDPSVLNKVVFKAGIKGDAGAVSVSGGSMTLDDSTLTFSANAKDFQKPDLAFDLKLDAIDVDRYLPPSAQKQAAKDDKQAQSSGKKAKTDYAPLRKMVLDGKATIGNLKVANMKMANVKVHLKGRNGVFDLDPFSMDLYQGTAGLKARVDVRKNTPKTAVTLKLAGIQAGPMIKDAAAKEVIEGTLAADAGLAMTGDTPELIKKTLGGKGELTFTDGAIVGIDIAGTIRNAASGLGMAENPTAKPKTDFAELKIPYTASKGLVSIPGASLSSPLLRLGAKGKTNLVKEDLDFRVDPKLVATLKGQGDTKDRSGLLIPLLITGTYAQPKIRPDLKAMIGNQLPTDKEGLKNLLKGGGTTNDGKQESVEDKAKSLIKGLFN